MCKIYMYMYMYTVCMHIYCTCCHPTAAVVLGTLFAVTAVALGALTVLLAVHWYRLRKRRTLNKFIQMENF